MENGLVMRFLLFTLLGVLLLASCAVEPTPDETSNPVTPSPSSPDQPDATLGYSPSDGLPLSVPELLNAALERGVITSDQHLLYLAYAIYEPESLPEEYYSEAPWRGTLYVMELKQAANSTDILCAMPLETRKELQRLVTESATCTP